MTIKLYITPSDPKSVNKELTNEKVISGVARDPLDILNPVIEVEDASLSIAAYNYMYIEDYSRYYFIETRPDSYNYETITGRHDVLMNSKSYLLPLKATLRRAQRYYNGYLIDDEYNAYAYKNIVTKSFPTGITGDSIILMTVG